DHVGNDEKEGIAEHLAKSRIAQRVGIIGNPDERPKQRVDVAQIDLLQTHQKVVDDREADQADEIDDRRQQEDIEQRSVLELGIHPAMSEAGDLSSIVIAASLRARAGSLRPHRAVRQRPAWCRSAPPGSRSGSDATTAPTADADHAGSPSSSARETP